jgi:hypothetical protein
LIPAETSALVITSWSITTPLALTIAPDSVRVSQGPRGGSNDVHPSEKDTTSPRGRITISGLSTSIEEFG